MPECGITIAVFILKQVAEEMFSRKKIICTICIFRFPRELLMDYLEMLYVFFLIGIHPMQG